MTISPATRLVLTHAVNTFVHVFVAGMSTIFVAGQSGVHVDMTALGTLMLSAVSAGVSVVWHGVPALIDWRKTVKANKFDAAVAEQVQIALKAVAQSTLTTTDPLGAVAGVTHPTA